MPLIPALKKQRQADLTYIARLCLKECSCAKWNEWETVEETPHSFASLTSQPSVQTMKGPGKRPRGPLWFRGTKANQNSYTVASITSAVMQCLQSVQLASPGKLAYMVMAVCPEAYIQLLVSALHGRWKYDGSFRVSFLFVAYLPICLIVCWSRVSYSSGWPWTPMYSWKNSDLSAGITK